MKKSPKTTTTSTMKPVATEDLAHIQGGSSNTIRIRAQAKGGETTTTTTTTTTTSST